MPVGIAKVETRATQLPLAFLFDQNPVLRQPQFPIRQLRRFDRKSNMQFTVTVMLRRDIKRATLLEKQQNLSLAGFHRATPFPKVTDNLKCKNSFVKRHRTPEVRDIQ